MKTDKQKLAVEVQNDFETRKTARRQIELQWQLNIDFLHGRQNNYITNMNTVASGGKRYFWQSREVYNHIAPLIESRMAKLAGAGEQISVVPIGSGEKDAQCAEKCEQIVKAAFKKVDMKSLADQANMWAEMTGTAFYKVVWDNNAGRVVGRVKGDKIEGAGEIREGDVSVTVCSPFEIYPDSLTAGDINRLGSIIHARPLPINQIKNIWGVEIAGGDVEVHDFNNTGSSAVLRNAALVIERYKDGELTIVAGDKVLYHGAYDFMPFIRQTCESLPCAFFGKSVIERAVPVQRAYNAVKNRKTEFLNRLTCGVIAVEENSVDIEALETDGLAPGTIVQYRSGSVAPRFLDGGSVPAELEREEERLLTELATITGGSDISRGEFSNVSGVAMEIMVAQDLLRIRRSLQSGQSARGAVASMVLKLYRKYAKESRLDRLTHGKTVNVFTWTRGDITSDEIEVSDGK